MLLTFYTLLIRPQHPTFLQSPQTLSPTHLRLTLHPIHPSLPLIMAEPYTTEQSLTTDSPLQDEQASSESTETPALAANGQQAKRRLATDANSPTSDDSTTAPPAKRPRTAKPGSGLTQVKVTNIDPEGDLVVAISRDPPRYTRISTRHITLISPVFRAMLGPDFVEGQSTHNTIKTALRLPEDDVKGMRLLFQLAHWQITDPKEIDVEAFPELLVACDKYGCFLTFKFLLKAVWDNYLAENEIPGAHESQKGIAEGHSIGASLIGEAICVAYLFEDRQRFKEAMMLLFRHMTEEDIEQMSSLALMEIMPKAFLEGLVSAWQMAVTGAAEWVIDKLEDFQARLVNGETLCSKTETRLGFVHHAISRIELKFQDDGSDTVLSFGEIERTLSGIIDRLESRDTAMFPARGRGCRCTKCMSLRLREHLLMPWQHRKQTRGCACLECFKETNYEAEAQERECQHG